VTTLKAGVAYAFTVKDQAAIHDFHLTGPGVNKVITSVPFTETVHAAAKRQAFAWLESSSNWFRRTSSARACSTEGWGADGGERTEGGLPSKALLPRLPRTASCTCTGTGRPRNRSMC